MQAMLKDHMSASHASGLYIGESDTLWSYRGKSQHDDHRRVILKDHTWASHALGLYMGKSCSGFAGMNKVCYQIKFLTICVCHFYVSMHSLQKRYRRSCPWSVPWTLTQVCVEKKSFGVFSAQQSGSNYPNFDKGVLARFEREIYV